MRRSKRTVEKDAMKAIRKQMRDEEIEKFGHPISYRRVFRDRKKYFRKSKHSHRFED